MEELTAIARMNATNKLNVNLLRSSVNIARSRLQLIAIDLSTIIQSFALMLADMVLGG